MELDAHGVWRMDAQIRMPGGGGAYSKDAMRRTSPCGGVHLEWGSVPPTAASAPIRRVGMVRWCDGASAHATPHYTERPDRGQGQECRVRKVG